MSSNREVTPENLRLFELVKEASEGKLALPQFQRSFVWAPEDIRELLVSVFNTHFIGAILVMDTNRRSPPFAIRAVEGCEVDEENLPRLTTRVLLDGQQRISSLYYAFYSPDIPLKNNKVHSTVFFIDLQKLFSGDVDSAITYKLKRDSKDYELDRGEWQFSNLIVPLDEILNWFQWEGEYTVWLSNNDNAQFKEWSVGAKSSWDKTIQSVMDFRVPVLTLSSIEENNREQLEEICTIFEKVNNTGVRLNVFDLLTARLYPQGVNTHALWESALETSTIFAKYSDGDESSFGLLVLRYIALVRRHDLKSKALINLSHEEFEHDWMCAVHYFNEAYTRLSTLDESGFGVFSEKWLPSTSLIPVLAALLQKRDSLDGPRQTGAAQAIRWWYWGSVFTVRYTGSVETVSLRDYSELSRYFEDGNVYPEVFRNIYNQVVREQSEFSLLEVERKNNTLYKAVMCLLARNGARDFRRDESIAFSQLDDHHIFPQGYLKSSQLSSILQLTGTALYNTIVNRTLISAGTNRAIGMKAPSVYLADESIIGQEHKRELLGQHFVSDVAFSALETDNYEQFLESRHSALLCIIRSLFEGLPAPPGN